MSEKIEHEGIISQIKEGKTYVTIMQNPACAGCHAQSMCQISEQKEKIIEIPHIETSLGVGDKVLVVGKTSMGLQAVFYAFVAPLILIVATLAVCLSHYNSETWAALAAIVILAIYFFVLYLLKSALKKKFVFMIKELKESKEIKESKE